MAAQRLEERRSIWRVGPESTWTTTLPVTFIIASLLSLVLLPIIVSSHTRRMRTRGYIAYHLKKGAWWRIPTDSALQPPDGFTVAAYEDEEELAQLCETYESASDEGRRLIRLVAELSVLSARKPF